MPGPLFREGETVELRTVEEEDVEFLQSNVNDPRTRESVMSSAPITRKEEQEWVETIAENDGAHFLVCVDGDPVGSIGYDDPHEVWGLAEVGYAIHPDHWGNGYATDALREVCGHAFEERRVHKLVAQASVTNPASCRVLEKNGFAEEGVFRQEAFVEGEWVDVRRYGLLADDWHAE